MASENRELELIRLLTDPEHRTATVEELRALLDDPPPVERGVPTVFTLAPGDR